MKKNQDLTLKRMECNELILKQLTEYIHANPHIRFSQALRNLEIVTVEYYDKCNSWRDDFYTEPEKILERMKKG